MKIKQKQILNTELIFGTASPVVIPSYTNFVEFGLGALSAQVVNLPSPAGHSGKMMVVNNKSNFDCLSNQIIDTAGNSPFGNSSGSGAAFKTRSSTVLIAREGTGLPRWQFITRSALLGRDMEMVVLAKGSILLGNPITTGVKTVVGGVNVATTATVSAQAVDRTTVQLFYVPVPINNNLTDYFINAQMRSNTGVVLNDNNFIISTVAQTNSNFTLSMRRLTNVVTDVILDFQITTTR
jgi:hypothetical protein